MGYSNGLRTSYRSGSEPPRREEPVTAPINGIVQPPVLPPPTRPARTTNQLRFIEKCVLKVLWRHRDAWPFHNPVDTIALDIPDYHEIVKYPMDLSTIKKRLQNQYYWKAEECIRDFDRIFKNCYLYNKPELQVVMMARNLENVYRAQLAKMPDSEVVLGLPVQRDDAGFRRAKRSKMAACNDQLERGSKLIMETESKRSLDSFSQVEPAHARGYHPPLPLGQTLDIQTKHLPAFNEFSPKKQHKKRAKVSKISLSDIVTSAIPDQQPPPTKQNPKPPTRHWSDCLSQLPEPMKACAVILEKLFSEENYEYASPFYEPLNAPLLGLNDCVPVKKPMDLGTVRTKMLAGKYRWRAEFARDVRSIFTNCYRHRPEDDPVVVMAHKLQCLFELLYAKIPEEADDDDDVDSCQLKRLLAIEQEKLFSLLGQEPLLYEEKMQLVADISELPQEERYRLVRIIEWRESSFSYSIPGPVVIDIEAMEPSTLRHLQAYVASYFRSISCRVEEVKARECGAATEQRELERCKDVEPHITRAMCRALSSSSGSDSDDDGSTRSFIHVD